MFDPFTKLRPYLPRTLFWRTFFIMLLPVIIAQMLTTYVFFDRHWERMTGRLAQGVAGEIATLRDLLERYGDAQGSVLLTDLQAQYAAHMKLAYSFHAGEHRDLKHEKRRTPFEIDATLKDALDRQIARPYAVVFTPSEKRVVVDIQLQNGLLTVELPQNRLYDSSGYIFILWLNGLSIVFFGVSILFMRNQIRPIRKLAIAADMFGRGGSVEDLKPTGAREVRRAAESFLNMASRISRQMHQRTAMLAGVSHDMRTPLTRMRLQLALMDKSEDTQALQGDVAAMEAMIDSYLSFARDAGDEQGQVMNLTPVLARVVEDAKRAGTDVTLDSPKNVQVFVRPIAFERAITNLLDNARLHGKPPVAVKLSVDGAVDHAILTIDDAGAGIAPEKRGDVFKPFVRLNAGAGRGKASGTGLGLSIAQDVVLAHGGRIELSQSPQGGLRVIVHLPLAPK